MEIRITEKEMEFEHTIPKDSLPEAFEMLSQFAEEVCGYIKGDFVKIKIKAELSEGKEEDAKVEI